MGVCTIFLLIIRLLILVILSTSLNIYETTWYKIMVELIKKMFIGLLISLENASNHVKCISLSNQKYIIQPTLINLHPVEYSEELHYYPFAVKLGRCFGSCNTLNDLFNKACVPNKTEDLI